MVKDYVRGSLSGDQATDPQSERPAASRLSQPEVKIHPTSTPVSPPTPAPSPQSQPAKPRWHKSVTLPDVEINLSAIGEFLSKPFIWAGLLLGLLIQKVTGKTSSRRGRMSSADSQLLRIKIIRWVAVASLGAVVVGVIGFFALLAWYSKDLPKPGEVVRRQGFSTRIFDRNNQLLYDLYNTERRVPVKVEDLPQSLKDATVAVEDRDFYKHSGFDKLTILRIPYNIVFRRRLVGGSTLTQQLVKNALLTNERTVTRKFKELVLAIQIERRFSKDEILLMYLNEAPYGGTAWGVGAAADMYFGKKVSELTPAESAFLAGLPQRPSAYSPLFGKTADDGTPLWRGRTITVLERMKEQHYLTEASYAGALSELDTMQFKQTVSNIKAPHFVFYVRDQLEEMFGEEIVESGGLQVTTTLDLPLHDEAQMIVKEEVEKNKIYHLTNGAAMVMNPKTGEILSMVGSADYFAATDEATDSAEPVIGGQFNVAVDGLRQPGSSIKPVTYLALLEQGYAPASVLMDVETTFTSGIDPTEKPYQPNNYDGKFHGPVSIRDSLGSSLNIPAVKALALVRVDNFLTRAHSMGFETLEPTSENMKRFGLAVTLGGGEVHLIDTVTAYSAFANGGRKIEPVAILKVQDMNGNTLYEHKNVEGPQVIQPEHAFLIDHILSDNSARIMAFGPSSLLNTGKPIAVKTGTTNDRRDNWTIGWSQEIMVGTWVGNNDNSPMERVASGITGASPIWRRIIDSALKNGYDAPEWIIPPNVEAVRVDSISGYPTHDGFPEKADYVVKGTVPSLPDPIHTKLKLCRGEEKLATDARVSAGDYDEKEYIVLRNDDPVSKDGKNRWQEAIDAWINGQSDSKYKPPTEYCGDNNEIYIELKQPKGETSYEGEDIEVEVKAESNQGIDKIEIMVNGSVRETVNNREYKGKLHLSKDRYEIWAKAYTKDGKTKESNRARIGTGGKNWKEDPVPSPSPSLSPLPSPTPTPSLPAVVPSPT